MAVIKRKCGADFVYLIRGCGITLKKINVPNTPHSYRYGETEDAISPYRIVYTHGVLNAEFRI